MSVRTSAGPAAGPLARPSAGPARTLAGAAAALLLGLTVTAPAHADVGAGTHAAARVGAVHLVGPGESIQQAVDRAAPGDTVLIPPGTYHGSVQISVPGLTLRGLGPQTVISGQGTSSPQTADAAAAPDSAAAACAQAGHGICVTGTAGHRLADVTIEALTVSGFAKNGISATETDRMTVRQVLVRDNGQEGISQERSTRGRFQGNEALRNGEAGIFLANFVDVDGGATDTDGALVADNHLADNRIGVVLRRLRNLSVERNDITGNCTGVFVVGDENVPRGGDLDVRLNRVNANNRYCPSNGKLPFLQGSGIVLTGVEQTRVTGNEVVGNTGAAPMSGGIVLFRSFVGGPSTDNTISRNVLRDNGPADLADRDTGSNTFAGNQCRTSEPAGRC
ncbi:right-handed parallel beta-helix repeat-containing protein [Kitasatospora nipponensis]|uniref:Right-handed parallel beta-helix repeat-containing protein n=1 Tax=Kitasatospora nipponensis TaxID=258049 RepID=A0ABN2ZBX8_9ACTN